MVGKLSLLDDVHFSLETITKVIEDTLASESKEYLGIKLEVVEDVDISERHKVIEISNALAKQKNQPATFGRQAGQEQAKAKSHKFLLSYTSNEKQASISLFVFNEKSRKINSDIIIILSQDLIHNQLMMVDEQPLHMEEDNSLPSKPANQLM